MKKLISLLLSLTLLVGSAGKAFAALPEEDTIDPMHVYMGDLDADLTINESTGVATCTGRCPVGNADSVTLVCTLQRYNNMWITVKRWTVTSSLVAAVQETWTVTSGQPYRVYVTATAYDADGNELESGFKTAGYFYPPQS